MSEDRYCEDETNVETGNLINDSDAIAIRKEEKESILHHTDDDHEEDEEFFDGLNVKTLVSTKLYLPGRIVHLIKDTQSQ